MRPITANAFLRLHVEWGLCEPTGSPSWTCLRALRNPIKGHQYAPILKDTNCIQNRSCGIQFHSCCVQCSVLGPVSEYHTLAYTHGATSVNQRRTTENLWMGRHGGSKTPYPLKKNNNTNICDKNIYFVLCYFCIVFTLRYFQYRSHSRHFVILARGSRDGRSGE